MLNSLISLMLSIFGFFILTIDVFMSFVVSEILMKIYPLKRYRFYFNLLLATLVLIEFWSLYQYWENVIDFFY